jgi:hypothetical protein
MEQGIFDWDALRRSAERIKLSDPMPVEEPKVTYIAVIARSNMLPGYAHSYSSNRPDGGWFALMGTDRDAIIDDALDKVAEFETMNAVQYEVWVGTITDRVKVPRREYKIVPLDGKGSRL